MLFRDIITLIKKETVFENGFPKDSETPREVFANRKSVRQSEFYQASGIGIKLEKMFEIRTVEYDGETELIHEEKRYIIQRTYDKNNEMTELLCNSAPVTQEV